MVKLNANFQTNTQSNNTQTQATSTANDQAQTQPAPPKSESNLMTIIGQCLPFAPLVFEQFTGQKVPQLSGTMAEIQSALTALQVNLQQVLNNQQQI
jgi:hypothetical protein